jgi:hypothetical protein
MLSDNTERPFFFGMGFAGTEVINDDYTPNSGLLLPDSVPHPPPPTKQELGFNAPQIRLKQEGYFRQHRHRDESR